MLASIWVGTFIDLSLMNKSIVLRRWHTTPFALKAKLIIKEIYREISELLNVILEGFIQKLEDEFLRNLNDDIWKEEKTFS